MTTLFMDAEHSEQNERTWSLEEANKLIPIVTQAFDGIFALNDKIEAKNKDITVLHEIWGVALVEPDNPDCLYYKELRQERANLQKRIELAVAELRNLGCAIDDLKRGIVHFHHKTPRGVVVFCWRYGEQRVNHWHEISWRAARKPVGLAERI